MKFPTSVVVPLAALQILLGIVHGKVDLFRVRQIEIGPLPDPDDPELLGSEGYNSWGTFTQLIDHSNPDLGTFEQRYWYSTRFWNGPGSPIFLTTPGEGDADRFNLTLSSPKRLQTLFAKATGGAAIILEHRYWGGSSPFQELTVENLKYLTLANSIKDLVYFANNFVPPFDPSGASSPKNAPWIYTGGSYSGALAGWMAQLDPGTFWAYHGTSAVVETVRDFWRYFGTVQQAMPTNCSRDVTLVIDYVDDVLLHGSESQKQALKNRFGLGDLQDVEFASALTEGPGQWQSSQFFTYPLTGHVPFFQFCDFVENVEPGSENIVPGPRGVGLEKALDGYVKWFTELALPHACESYGYEDFAGEFNTGCFQYLNASNPIYSDLTVLNPGNRQWEWMLCNEAFQWWMNGAPRTETTVVSRLLTYQFWFDQCKLRFGLDFGSDEGRSAFTVNLMTGGWSVDNLERLMYVNGQLDPWRDATVSSTTRPGGPLRSTKHLPVFLIRGGIHCSDYYGENWAVNPDLQNLVNEEVSIMAEWVAEWYDQTPR